MPIKKACQSLIGWLVVARLLSYLCRYRANRDVVNMLFITSGIPPQYGPTGMTRRPSSLHREYPCRYGANGLMLTLLSTGSGIPPQVRGERRCGIWSNAILRYTPVGTGRAASLSRCHPGSAEYPRRYGASLHADGRAAKVRGIPPQVRGERHVRDDQPGEVRNTPVGTGRAHEGLEPWELVGEYPRRYGASIARVV